MAVGSIQRRREQTMIMPLDRDLRRFRRPYDSLSLSTYTIHQRFEDMLHRAGLTAGWNFQNGGGGDMRIRQVDKGAFAAKALPFAKLDVQQIFDVKQSVNRNAFFFLPKVIKSFWPNEAFRRRF